LGNLSWDQPPRHSCIQLTGSKHTRQTDFSSHYLSIQLWNMTNAQSVKSLMLISAPAPQEESEPCKGHTHTHTHAHTHISDWSSQVNGSSQRTSTSVGAGPFAFIHRKLTAL